MTLIVQPGKVINTESTNISVGGKVTVGGSLTNSGIIKVYENGTLDVKKDMLNEGSLIINDPERIKQLLIEIVKTTGSLAGIGKKVLDVFFGIK